MHSHKLCPTAGSKTVNLQRRFKSESRCTQKLQYAFANCNDRCNLLLRFATIVAICFCRLQRSLQYAFANCNAQTKGKLTFRSCKLQKHIATIVAICKSKLQRSLQSAKANCNDRCNSQKQKCNFSPHPFLSLTLSGHSAF
jgi:hypothetical protein